LFDKGKEKDANLLYQRLLAILLNQWDVYEGPEAELAVGYFFLEFLNGNTPIDKGFIQIAPADAML